MTPVGIVDLLLHRVDEEVTRRGLADGARQLWTIR
jgi:hypothetical protein